MIEWMSENVDWVFSGVGTAILGLIATFFTVKELMGRQKQKAGQRSRQYQSLEGANGIEQVQRGGDDSIQIQKGSTSKKN